MRPTGRKIDLRQGSHEAFRQLTIFTVAISCVASVFFKSNAVHIDHQTVLFGRSPRLQRGDALHFAAGPQRKQTEDNTLGITQDAYPTNSKLTVSFVRGSLVTSQAVLYRVLVQSCTPYIVCAPDSLGMVLSD